MTDIPPTDHAPFEIMRFTLTYDGELPASGNRSKPEKVWEIRRALDPQLDELCQNHLALKHAIKAAVIPPQMSGGFGISERYHLDPEEAPDWRQSHRNLFAPIGRGGKLFTPIVRESLALACGLDILFLRKEEPGSLILQGGDIDNRIKTLFDALHMPTLDDMASAPPGTGALYCLLENDSLITDCAIKTDRLLSRPNSSVKDVRLVIRVDIKVLQARTYNMGFLSE